MKKLIIGISALTLAFAVIISQKDSKADERSAIATYTCNKLERFLHNDGKMLDTKKTADEKNIKFAKELCLSKGCKLCE